MESAFQHYAKKKKFNELKLKIKKKKEKKNSSLKSSTPLPRLKSTLFPVIPDSATTVENIFLSPILSQDSNENRGKESSQEDNKSPIHDFDFEIKTAKKKKKEKQNKKFRHLNGSSGTAEEVPNFIEVDSLERKQKAYKLETASMQDSEEVFNKNVFKTKTSKRKRETCDNGDVRKGKKIKKLEKEGIFDSVEEGKQMLSWLLSPVTVEEFFDKYWEKRPLHISRNCMDYFDGICGRKDLEQAYEQCPMYFLKNVTVTSYKDGKRTTDTTPGRARPNVVRDLFTDGNSIRVLNPQTFIPNVGSIVSSLQEYFRCMVGVNSYLTPAGTQGFAPHYDDIEAFVLQMEGEKEWKVYPPRSESETLPRFSSPDFNQSDIGEPILEVTLRAGDLLYFPRGFIHQARSLELHHSLHLTVSTYQCNTWGDFFSAVLPMALEQAITKEVELRKGLPLDFIDHMGLASEGSDAIQRSTFIARAKQLFAKIIDHCPWDDAADHMGKEFIHSSYPPYHEELNKKTWKKLFNNPSPNTAVKLITANACRITSVDQQLVVYYSTDNSYEPKGEEPLGFEVSPEEAAVLEKLRNSYPKYCKLKRLSSVDDQVTQNAVTDLLLNLAQRALLKVKLAATPDKG